MTVIIVCIMVAVGYSQGLNQMDFIDEALVTKDSMYLIVNFNEPMDTVSVKKKENYLVIDTVNEDTVSIYSVGIVETDTTIVRVILLLGRHVYSTEHRVEVSNVYDLSNNVVNDTLNFALYHKTW